MADNPYPYDTGLVRELLKNKRKVRGIRSCFPCRHRKVRCDGQVPCSSCVKRNHPELCRVPNSGPEEGIQQQASPSGRLDIEASLNRIIEDRQVQSSTDNNLLISRLEKIEEQISSLKADLRTASVPAPSRVRESSGGQVSSRTSTRLASKSPGRYYVEDATGATIYLGSRSDAPLVLGCRQPATTGDVMLQSAMMDQFVPRAYPFTNLWGMDATAQNVCETLPDDSDIIRYWQTYQSAVYPFYPTLVTADQFSQSLFAFLDQRASAGETNRHVEEPNSSWLALLFAVLASGVQFSDDLIKERDLRSRVFVCSSFQCLRLSNFFNNTNLDQIQAMALIGHCLRNNLDTNSAWILMGATIRLAQSIGLHEPSLSLSASEQHQRNRLWWMLIWQDTFLSLTYDRPPSSITGICPIPLTPYAEGLTFQESVFTICKIILDRTQLENSGVSHPPMESALESRRELESIWHTVAPFLRDKSRCTSLQQHLERLALGIHLGYTICRFTWMYLDSARQEFSVLPDTIEDCVQQAIRPIESFLDLHRFSSSVCRSWAFVHNAVSCAITLKSAEQMLPEETNRSEIIIQRLIVVLEKEERDSEWVDTDTNVRHFGPYSRAQIGRAHV